MNWYNEILIPYIKASLCIIDEWFKNKVKENRCYRFEMKWPALTATSTRIIISRCDFSLSPFHESIVDSYFYLLSNCFKAAFIFPILFLPPQFTDFPWFSKNKNGSLSRTRHVQMWLILYLYGTWKHFPTK